MPVLSRKIGVYAAKRRPQLFFDGRCIGPREPLAIGRGKSAGSLRIGP